MSLAWAKRVARSAWQWGMRLAGIGLLVACTYLIYEVRTAMRVYNMNVVEAVWVATENGTQWAPGFSERKFDQLHLGMTRANVIDLLGEPLCKIVNRDGREHWVYSLGKDGGYMSNSRFSTHTRAVIFGEEKSVVEFYRTYYFD